MFTVCTVGRLSDLMAQLTQVEKQKTFNKDVLSKKNTQLSKYYTYILTVTDIFYFITFTLLFILRHKVVLEQI